jgi:hypothetical protein
MSRRHGPSLTERGLAGARPAPPPDSPPSSSSSSPPAAEEPAVPEDRPRAVLHRHCWVTGLPARPGRWAGLVAEWRQDREAGGWQGRVVYAVDDGRTTVLVEAWVAAHHLDPAG